MLDYSDKEKRITNIAKWVFAIVGLAILAPVLSLAVQGIAWLVAFLVSGVLLVNFAPLFGRLVAIYRIKALKKLAEAHPIETLEVYISQRRQRLEADDDARDDFAAALGVQKKQIEDYEREFPDGAEELWQHYNDDVALLESAEQEAEAERQNIAEADVKLRQLKMRYNISQGRNAMAKGMKGRVRVSEDDRTSVKAAIQAIEDSSARSSATLARLSNQRQQHVSHANSISELRVTTRVPRIKEQA